MWWWVLGVLSCVLLVSVVIFFLTTGQRYKVFSEKCLRPPGPLVTDNKQRDDRLKRGTKVSGVLKLADTRLTLLYCVVVIFKVLLVELVRKTDLVVVEGLGDKKQRDLQRRHILVQWINSNEVVFPL